MLQGEALHRVLPAPVALRRDVHGVPTLDKLSHDRVKKLQVPEVPNGEDNPHAEKASLYSMDMSPCTLSKLDEFDAS
jgi:hypothetical protein